MIRRLCSAAVTVVLACGLLTAALAAQGPQGPGQTAAQEEFVPVKPGELGQEQLPAAPLVFAAYAFVWFAMLAYVVVLWRRLGRVERDLAEVSSRLEGRRR